MKTVMLVGNSDFVIYKFRKELAEKLCSDGYKVYIVVPTAEYGEYASYFRKLGCEVVEVEMDRRGTNPMHDYSLYRTYHKLIGNLQPDVVCTYTIKPNIYAGMAAKKHGVKYIVNITGLGTAIENPGLLSWMLLRLYKYALKDALCVFFQNEKNYRFMKEKKVLRGRTKVLPGSGVNLKEKAYVEYASEIEGIHFLAVLRIMKDKGVAEYLEAVDRLKQSYPYAVFHLAGAYEEESRVVYAPQIEKLVQEGKLVYHGYSHEVQTLMANSHVIIHPSYHEGLSNVLLEGAAIGRPVLASNIEGCKEAFVEGITGYGFAPKSVDALCDAAEKILHLTEESRRIMGIAGRKYMEDHFDRKIVTEEYMKLIV